MLHLLGAAGAEVVGTLCFAAVFGVTLLNGRVAGLVAAAVSTGLYAWMRRGAMDDAGTMQLAVVVVGRAASYFVLAHVTHVMRDRLPQVPVLTFALPGRQGAMVDSPRPAYSSAEAQTTDFAGGVDAYGDPAAEAYVDSYEPEAYQQGGFAAQDLTAAPYAVDGYAADGYAVGGYAGDGYAAPDGYEPVPEESWMAGNGGMEPGNGFGAEMPPMEQYPPPGDEWATGGGVNGFDMPPSVEGLGREQFAPQMPSGWDEPSHDGFGEEIPVGHTGELFLQDLQGPPGPVGQEPLGYGEQPEYYGADDGFNGYDYAPGPSYEQDMPLEEAPAHSEPVLHVDPETRLWTAGYFRDRLVDERERARVTGVGFSVVMIQIPDTPFQTLSYRREVALLRELGHQFVRAQVVDHLVHLPDQGQHWFAVVLSGTDKPAAHAFERRLRAAIAGYLRNRGLGLDDVQSAALTSPDDDEMMETIWASLLGGALEDQGEPQAAWSSEARW